MAKTLTAANNALNVWDDGDNPGAGTKGVRVDQNGGDGLNANWESIDKGLFTEHNIDGTHKDGTITGVKLKQTSAGAVVDGSTLEFNSNQMRVKDAGVTTAKLADGAVTTAKLGTDSVDANILKDDASIDANRAVTTNHIRDNSITGAKIAHRTITADKLSEEIGWQFIFGDTRVAGSSAGNSAPAVTEWVETSTTAVVKLSFFLPQILNGTSRVLLIRANAKTDNATKAWTAQLKNAAGGVLASDTGTNTSYGSSPELGMMYGIVDGSATASTEFQLCMLVASGGTFTMKNLCVFIIPALQEEA